MFCRRPLLRALGAVPRQQARAMSHFSGGPGQPPSAGIPLPYITEVSSSGWRTYDIFSKLLQERIICLNGAIDDTVSASIVAQLLWLESDNPDKAITLYINSPGGSVSSGLAIYDTMTYIKSPVSTVCLGAASSMGALLLTGGEAGKRYALPHSSVMIHQPLGGTQGQASDILIYANQIQRVRTKLNEIMRRHLNAAFGRERYNLEEVNDMMERDKYLSPEEAKEIGVIDEILTRRTEKDEKEKDKDEAQKTKPTARATRDETRAAFAAQVDKALQTDEHGAALKLHPETKTITTAAGDLPISPVMDPAWIEARQRFRTPKPKTPAHTYVGRFRKKLYMNPYAQALATPWRLCTATETGLPRYFLQDFRAVTNPDTGVPWYVPGDLTDPPKGSSSSTPADEPPAAKNDDAEADADDGNIPDDIFAPAQRKHPRPNGPSAPVGYTIARHEALDLLGAPRHTSTLGGRHASMLARRAPLSKAGLIPRLVWRPKMHILVLDLMRTRAVDQLRYLARLDSDQAGADGSDPRGYVRPCTGWAAIDKSMPHRGCVLWYADATADAATTPGQWATLDVEGAKYEGKLPVHDLKRLLGEEHLARLREEPVFRDNTLLVLGKRRTIEVQLLLWKLQGYLAEYDAPAEEALVD
ncbi:hypothetical protein ACHAQA_005990 [Verticillium albo-atrum]